MGDMEKNDEDKVYIVSLTIHGVRASTPKEAAKDFLRLVRGGEAGGLSFDVMDAVADDQEYVVSLTGEEARA